MAATLLGTVPRVAEALRGRSRGGSYQQLQVIAYLGLSLIFTLYVIGLCVRLGTVAVDFHHEFWPAARLVANGASPYGGSWQRTNAGVAFPYPALTALAFVPLALIPHGAADGVFTAVNIAAVLLTLRVLDVRDRRVYGLVLLWPSVVQAWQTANLTLVIGLGIAWLWRMRDNPIVAGAIVAVLISLKPFIWPLGLWLLATRRYAAAAYAVAVGLAVNAVAWGVVGFDQLRRYEDVSRAVTKAMYKRGYDVVALAMHLGAAHAAAYVIALAVASAVAVGCIVAGRRGDSQAALTLSIVLSLLATPVLWGHYFALLVIPSALARPRLSGVWFLPLLMWVCPVVKPDLLQAILGLGVSAAIVVTVLVRPRLRTRPSSLVANTPIADTL